MLFKILFPDEGSITEVTLEFFCTRVDQHMRSNVRFLSERLLTYSAFVVLLACVYLEVHPEIARITKGLTAVFTLMRLHPHVSHKVHIEFSGRYEGPGAHAALELLFSHMSLAFHFGCSVTRAIMAVVSSTVAIVIVSLSCSGRGARPG